MASVQTASGSVAFSAIVLRAIDRLAQKVAAYTAVGVERDPALDPDAVYASIRLCLRPESDISTYLSEPGFVVRVRPATPFKDSGGGRHDYRVSRIVDVFVLTQSLADTGGRDDTAAVAHMDAEDLVVDALHDQPPVGEPNNTRIPVTFKWVPGGAEIVRQMDIDPGLIVSCLSFESIYRQPLLVTRD